jgi:indolepyruvate ferredoxin oxidoreductase alpha subunit
MAERSFVEEVEKLRLSAGEEFRGEAILAVTKALLQSGVSYIGGYQGAPISHLLDVFADANALLQELGVRFETSASEATACAMLAASVNYPLRGAVAWKSVVGTNVASDALANVASGGVKGGALIIVGEDYGEGSSIMQERTHAFAMKSQVWLLDPRPQLSKIVDMVEQGFELSEASNTPVMLELRIRACHLYGRFIAKDNVRPAFTQKDALENPVRDVDRIVLPPASFLHEREKVEQRWPAAVEFIKRRRLNETFGPDGGDVGLIVQGGLFNTLMRALQLLGLADIYGRTRLPIYCLNVTYPLIDDELKAFCSGKSAVLLVEEGQPEFIEQSLNTTLRQADLNTRVVGKEILPRAGEYSGDVLKRGLRAFLERYAPDLRHSQASPVDSAEDAELTALGRHLPPRPPGFCTGCPERPIFTAMKLVERETGPFHVSADIGCHLFSILPPFNIGNTTMGYGLGQAGSAAFNVKADKKALAVMGDGGFWHNGLTSGIGNAVFNQSDNVTLIVDNNYSAATGGQDIPSSRADNAWRSTRHAIAEAVKGVGVTWVRQIDRTYDLKAMTAALRDAMTSPAPGPKVIVAQSECMLNRQRRERPQFNAAVKAGERKVRERFGVDPETCTGDHSCIRLSGCPSLTVKPNPDPLRRDPIAHVDTSCVGCGLCGEVSHAAVLCPSFYRAEVVHNGGWGDRLVAGLRGAVIGWLQDRADAQRLARAF